MKPICSFKIEPRHSRLYYKVNIWKSQKELFKHCSWVKLRSPCYGLCSSFYVYRKGRMLSVCGEINLIAKHCSTEVVTHELCHAVVGWCRRKNIPTPIVNKEVSGLMDTNCGEERFCYAYGQLFRKMNVYLHKYGIWK